MLTSSEVGAFKKEGDVSRCFTRHFDRIGVDGASNQSQSVRTTCEVTHSNNCQKLFATVGDGYFVNLHYYHNHGFLLGGRSSAQELLDHLQKQL